MAIKSKNRYWYITIFILFTYLLGFSILSFEDVLKNRDYLSKDSYFSSYKFKNELVNYFNNVRLLNTTYKDYTKKSEGEKVTNEELLASKELYDSELHAKEVQIDGKYRHDIIVAQNEGNNDKVNRLKDSENKELEELKNENTKTTEDFKKEIVAYKSKDYEDIKAAVNDNKLIEYNISKGKNNIIDTNIAKVSDLDLYAKTNALYAIKFPTESIKPNDELAFINELFANSGEVAYFIISKDIDQNSYIYKSYIYYNSINHRVVKESIIGLIAFILALPIGIYIFRKSKEEVIYIKSLTKWYNKVPLDVMLIIFIIYSFIMSSYIKRIVFFYEPYSLGQIYDLTVIALYIFFFIFNIKMVISFKRNKEEFSIEIKKCFFYKVSKFIKESSQLQSIRFKVRGIIVLTLLLGVATLDIFVGVTGAAYIRITVFISMLYIICYMIFMLVYLVKTIGLLGEIIKGTDELVSGNLNYTIEERGTGEHFRLANNINNMKIGFKKSLENEIKSERLKSELITNVSHDLKTPLTSIINYIDLLKKEGLSSEKTLEYVSIVDRKSQRLKLLIDDLFEASKMASGAVELDMEEIDLTSLLQQALAELDEKINNSSLIFKLKLPKHKVYANLDGKRTWRVFENLINNILKYSQPETRVYIELLEEPRHAIITMKNVASYEMDFHKDEIFERFKRGDKSRNTEGSGLGLSIAKSIIELQGGSLSIEIDGDLFKAKVIIPSLERRNININV